MRPHVEKWLPSQTDKGVPLNVTQAILNIKGGVMEVSKPVVGQGELVTFHLDGVGRQGGKVGHTQNIELLALGQLDTKHGDSVKLAGKHRELLDILEVKCHGHHTCHVHLPQVKPVSHLHVLEAVSLDLQLMNVGHLYIMNCSTSSCSTFSFIQLWVDHHSVGVPDGDVLDVPHVVH